MSAADVRYFNGYVSEARVWKRALTPTELKNNKPIIPRSENQLKLVEGFAKNDMVFAIGPAGSGKTYTAIALAVRALKNKEIKKIILSRPAVEAGEKLGFLPGDMKDKIDPYLQPLVAIRN